jgi:hypothetical protein
VSAYHLTTTAAPHSAPGVACVNDDLLEQFIREAQRDDAPALLGFAAAYVGRQLAALLEQPTAASDTTPGYDYHDPPPVRQPAFTFRCPWGCTVHVEGGTIQPHTCQGTSAIVDALRVTGIEGTVLEHAERLARALDPVLDELLADVKRLTVERDGAIASAVTFKTERDRLRGFADAVLRKIAPQWRSISYDRNALLDELRALTTEHGVDR